ncbi:hypothetical protein M3Y97_00998600 [Aphelenchoides bicaudatus]|nr:hypothetical protein M3Y97_00998600 [Aphelenchoides bicaudatus]
MGNYKWYLLNIVFWSAALDIYLGVFYTPFLLFPATGVSAQGLLADIHHYNFKQFEFLFFIWLIGGFGVSLTCGFVYRLAAVTQSTPMINTKKALSLIALIHIFYTIPAMLPILYSNVYDYNSILDDMQRRYPAVFEYGLRHSSIYVSLKVTPTACFLFGLAALILITTCVLANTVLIWNTMKKINNSTFTISSRTMAMHKQLTTSLIAQFFLPAIFVAVPFIVIVVLFISDKMDNVWARLAGSGFFVVGSMHSTLNSIAMIIMTKPYRQCILRQFPARFHPKSSGLMVVKELTTQVERTSTLRRSNKVFGGRQLRSLSLR